MASNPKASVRFIFATILLDALGIGLLVPVFPDVIRRFGTDPDFVNHNFGYFISVYALMSLLVSPVLGSLSDKYGRRPVLLVSLFIAALDYLMMAFAPNLGLLFLGRVIAGLTGASMTVASSYMADISSDSNRGSNFGLIGAAFGLGFIIGPAAGGLLGHIGPEAPFVAAAALNLLNFLYGLFVLPESLPPESRREIDVKKLNPFTSVWKILKPSPIFLAVMVFFLLTLGGHSHPSIWTLYTEYKFGWTSAQVGMSLTCAGVIIALSQGFLTRILIPKWGERRSLIISNWFAIASFAGYALIPEGWMVYVVMIATCPSGLGGPAIQSMISKDVPPAEQGELQGSLMSLASLTAIIGPVFYTTLFSEFSTRQDSLHFPGAPYLAAAAFCLISLVLLHFVPKRNQ